ncbi:MAG: T9SS type A sorting domain-containing protein [Chitinophagales bacterium]|nr:T9SS type A sorting domain-containing protein [Chitinophagales bacterium]
MSNSLSFCFQRTRISRLTIQFSDWKLIFQILLFLGLASASQAQVVVNDPTLTVTTFNDVVATPLTNTAGQWVTFNPDQSNNIDLIETQIFKMPQRGLGVVGVEFQLFGGDGGTAWYKNLVDNRFANGGKGGELHYTLNLDNSNNYGKPFIVTYGKKGESVQYGQYGYVAAGGGGSTGMAWLKPTTPAYYFNLIDKHLIAAAGGGSGGFATVFRSLHGASAWFLGPNPGLNSQLGSHIANLTISVDGNPFMIFTAGGSRLLGATTSLNGSVCCSNNEKIRNSSGYYHNVFSQRKALNSSNLLSSITFGQEGGKPTLIWANQEGSAGNTTMGTAWSLGSSYDVHIVKNGGRGGAGLSGGGAGTSTTDYYQGFRVFDLGEEYDMSTGGAGGTGSIGDLSKGHFYITPADPGWNMFANGLTNTSIIPHNSTNNPKSGYFKYRTIADTVPPQINLDSITVYLKNTSLNPFAPYLAFQTDLPFSEAIQPYFMKPNGLWDNDSIVNITTSESVFQCFMAGQTIPVYLTLTDGAGNSTNGLIHVTVVDDYVPIPRLPESNPNIFDPGFTSRIDVSNGPVTLTAANFPQGFDGCNGSNVTINFPPTNFTCADVGSQPIAYSYTDLDNHQSDTFVKVFNVVYNFPDKLYVDASATGANNGTSWTDAFNSLQDALRFGCSQSGTGREVYVAQGTYLPDQGQGISLDDRNASFTLHDNDKVYGGFPTGGSLFSERDPAAYPSILSGNIGLTNFETDNSYHVVTIAGNKSVLDGFTIKEGYANANASDGGGAIKNVQVVIHDTLQYSTSSIQNCKFIDNFGNNGGAIYTAPSASTYNSNMDVINSSFENNTSNTNGGAIFLNNNLLRLYSLNCLFDNNTAQTKGGALHISSSNNAKVINNTFVYNDALVGGGAISNAGFISLNNSILFFNTDPNSAQIANTGTFHVDFSNIQGCGGSTTWALSSVIDYGGNIDADPQFNLSSPYTLMPQSPCRNAGKNNYNPYATDLYGKTRINEDQIDMGAAEINPVLYVAWDATGTGDGSSWANAYTNLNEAIANSGNGLSQKSIWVKSGTYYPDRIYRNSLPTPGNRENTFRLPNTSKIYGGFAGTETQLNQRNIGQNLTLLSGDIGTIGLPSDNVYHVITSEGQGSRLDGFIIEGGNANGGNDLSNGGGYFEIAQIADPSNVIANCVFRNNSAADKGGAIFGYVFGSSGAGALDIDHCVFYNNTANRGAVAYVAKGMMPVFYKLKLYNVTAVNNTSLAAGAGAIEGDGGTGGSGNFTARIKTYNSLLVANTPQNYNDINNPGNIQLFHTYVSDSINGVFKNVNDIAGADGKIMTNDDGLQLNPNSIAINYGDDSLLYNNNQKDITGQPRILQGVSDAGAYESWGCLGLSKLYVDANTTTTVSDGSTWAKAFKTINEALNVANLCTSVDSILIAKGTYYPGDPLTPISRDASFELWRPMALVGGYPSGGGIRDINANPVILSGDINTTDRNDNAVHIMRIGADTLGTTVIDGLKFVNGTGGSGIGGVGIYTTHGQSFQRGSGAAINSKNSKVWVKNCYFLNNFSGQGGAVYVNGGTFKSTHSIYDGNTAAQNGGAIRGGGITDSLLLHHNIFIRDTALGGGGGAVSGNYIWTLCYNELSNNVFVHTVGMQYGGGALYLSEGKFKVVNNTFYANKSVTGGGVTITVNPDTSNIFANNCFWNNTNTFNAPDDYSVSDYNNVIANNSTGIYPNFQDTLNLLGTDAQWYTEDDGLSLRTTSPLINGGNNNYVIDSSDLKNTIRVQKGIVDIGAYESDSLITRWYVNVSQDTIEADGSSWATAFDKFEDAIAVAKIGDTIWVAGGNYSPLLHTAFKMKSGVKIIGGFEGTETELTQRNLSSGFNTILCGNGSSVMINENVNSNALLDGFVIQSGTSDSVGGGILNINSQAHFNNIVFNNNQAKKGGAVANLLSNTHFSNIIFHENEAQGEGGAIFDSAATTQILSATFFQNNALNGSLLSQKDGSTLIMGNSISWGNSANEWFSSGSASSKMVTYSMLQSPLNGIGNIIDIDPKFTNPTQPIGFDNLWFTADDGLMAGFQSNFINKGNNALANSLATDISGANRIQNNIIDLGAYENEGISYCDSLSKLNSHALYVNVNAITAGDGFSWTNSLRSLTEALDLANYCDEIDSIYIASGTYYPTGFREGTDRTKSFVIKRSNLHLIGGCIGEDSTTNNSYLYPTILSGNINDDYDATDNSYHVVTIQNSYNVILEGVVIADGNADSTIAPFNSGGGLYIKNATSGNLILRNVYFTRNKALNGASIYNDGAAIDAINVLIDKGVANNGGAIFNEAGAITLTNSTIVNNDAINIQSSAIDLNGGQLTVNNSIMFGSISGLYDAAYSFIEGNVDTINGNLNTSGLTKADVFENDTIGNYKPKLGTTIIDAGNNGLFDNLNNNSIDFVGNSRVADFLNNGIIDIGAFESSSSSILPISLVHFYATKDGDKAKLEWATASELNNKEFIVFRAKDAIDFKEIGRVRGAGNSNIPIDYVYYDLQPLDGYNYYRLAQVDYDGTTEFLGIRMLEFSEDNREIQLYPNPSSTNVNIYFSKGVYSQLELIDVNSKVLYSLSLANSDNWKDIDLTNYSAGVYFIRLIGDAKSDVKKLVKK